MSIKTMKVNKKGMITIPNDIREKYKIEVGSEVIVMEINGEIQLIPIMDFEDLRKFLPSRKEMERAYVESWDEEMELEK